MKKLSISLIAVIFALPSYATGIGASAESADCVNGILGTYEGSSTLQAQWNANTINLDFYDGETKLSSGTCTYDGGIELPEDPTKTGYEFDGWKVRRAAAAPTQVKSCSEINNESECNAMANCYYYNDTCYEIEGVKDVNCSEYTNSEDCIAAGFSFYTGLETCSYGCFWFRKACNHNGVSCDPSGGSND